MINGFLDVRLQVAVYLFAFGIAKLRLQFQNQMFKLRIIKAAVLQFVQQIFHHAFRFGAEFISHHCLLLIQIMQLILVNIVCERASNFFDPVLCEITLMRLIRIHHNVNVRIRLLVVKRRVPSNIFGSNLLSRCNIRDMPPHQIAPVVEVDITHSFRILSS